MLLLLLSSLFVLSNGVTQMALHRQMNLTKTKNVISNVPMALQPQPIALNQFVANLEGEFDAKSLIEKLIGTDPAKVDRDPTKVFDAKNLIEELVDADPAKVKEVVALVEIMLQAAQADLDRLTLESTNANSAYDTAVSTYDAAVVAQVDGVAAEEKRIAARAVAAGLEEQAITDALSAKNIAEGAKTEAQDNLDAEKTRLEAEIASLKQVISILNGLVASGISVPQDGIYSWFKPTSANTVWPSSIGGIKGALIEGTVTVVTEAGNGAKSPISYLKGTRDSVYDFGAIVPETFTICSMSRYTTTTNQGRVLQGSPANWLHGHWHRQTGVCHYGHGWNTPHQNPPNTNWLIMCGSSDATQAVYENGVALPLVGSARAGNQNIWVNGGSHGGERSDWGVAEIITWDRVLTVTEIEQVSLAMRTELGVECAAGYKSTTDVGGWGAINGRGGGETVGCAECAILCSTINGCESYECGPTDQKCNLNKVGSVYSGQGYHDYLFCKKEIEI